MVKLMKTYQLFFIISCGVLYSVSGLTPAFIKTKTLEYLVLHLDLKGIIPRLTYLLNLTQELRTFGVNGLLLEYEASFPFEENIQRLNSRKFDGKKELEQFLKKTAEQGFELIPLVEIIGNLDYVLKYEEFVSLRESPESSDSICPSKDESIPLLEDIILQVINFHKNIAPIKFFHLGSAKPQHINECIYCRLRELKTEEIFGQHVAKIFNYVHSVTPNTQILMWDDMLQNHFAEPMSVQIQPVMQHADENLPNVSLIKKYNSHYGTVWASTAFKGVDGNTVMFPNLERRYQKQYPLMKLIRDLSLRDGFHFSGVILTGRSQYTEYNTTLLCELLTSSIPSLYLSLFMIEALKSPYYKPYDTKSEQQKNVRQYVIEHLKEHLQCDIQEYDNLTDNRYFTKCNYDGSDINKKLTDLRTDFDARRDLSNVTTKLASTMEKYYEKHFTNYYINRKIEYMLEKYMETNDLTQMTRRKPPASKRIYWSNSGDYKHRQKMVETYLKTYRSNILSEKKN